MNQAIVYAVNQQGYYQTTFPSDHPLLVLSRANSVKLSYTVCNEIFKGPSKFMNAQAQQIYNQYQRKLQTKGDLQKSQITADCSQKNYDLANSQLSQKQSNAQRIRLYNDKKSLFHSDILSKKHRDYINQKDLYKSQVQQELTQVRSENGSERQIKEKQQHIKLKNIITQKDKQIQYLKQALVQYKLKQQTAQKKLQLINIITNQNSISTSNSTVQYKNRQTILKNINALLALI